jgi:hypothetical protein
LHLMDAISATASRVDAMDIYARDPTLRIFPDLRDRMRLAPRYLLDDHVLRSSAELGLGRPSVFREAMRHLVIPYPRLWVEWHETSRDLLRRRLHEDRVTDPLKPIPIRLGFLLTCDPESGGRRGCVTWVWESPHASKLLHVPDISPYEVRFDLDARIEQPRDLVEGLGRAKLAQLWTDNAVQSEALRDIWRTAEHVPSKWGQGWLNSLTADQQRFLLADVYGEYIEIWALMLLLTSSRPTVEYRQVDLSRLNKARAKKRETPLLDHTTVTMHTSHRMIGERRSVPLGRRRASPRLHMVSSYLGRRGDKHWLVSPYQRGSGTAVERHVRVTR